MSDVIEQKIKQMHAALGSAASSDLFSLQVEFGAAESSQYIKVDFNQNSDPVKLANAATLLIGNIASLKDHLKVWCNTHSVPFKGDVLINSNRSVALVHDLWNIDKHAELTSKPRSGVLPKLRDLRTVLRLSSNTTPGSGAFFFMEHGTGQMKTGSSGGGGVELVLSAQVVDPNGVVLGDLMDICNKAVEAWLNELSSAGVSVP